MEPEERVMRIKKIQKYMSEVFKKQDDTYE